jgi:hypothetical protein
MAPGEGCRSVKGEKSDQYRGFTDSGDIDPAGRPTS